MYLRAALAMFVLLVQAFGSASAQSAADANASGLQGLSAAEAVLDAKPVIAEKVKVERLNIANGDYMASAGGLTFKILVPIHASYLLTAEYAITGTSYDQFSQAMTEVLAPFRDTCERIGGSMEYTDLKPVMMSRDSEEWVAMSRRLQHDKLTGQHVCVLNTVPAFAVAMRMHPRIDMMLLPPGHRYRTVLVTHAPAAIEQVLNVARVEAQTYAKTTDDLRREGKPGTPVQVDVNAIQVSALTVGVSSGWVCALLVDRKEGLMQVQIGATTLFVPSSAVVPQILKSGERPGLPLACMQASR